MTPEEILAKLAGGDDWLPPDYPAVGEPLPDTEPVHPSDLVLVPAHKPTIPDHTPPSTYKQAAGALLHLLSLSERPLKSVANAYQTAGQAYQSGQDPSAAFVRGAKRGFFGEDDTDAGDLLGIPRPQPSDKWGPWGAKALGHLLTNMPFDPLSYVGVPAKPASVVGKVLMDAGIPEGRSLIGQGLMKAGGEKLLNEAAGTVPWGMFARELPYTEKYGRVNKIWDVVKREGETNTLGDLALAANAKLEGHAKDPGITPEELRWRLFKGAETGPSDLNYEFARTVFGDVADEQARQHARQITAAQGAVDRGIMDESMIPNTLTMPNGGDYIAHVMTPETRRALQRKGTAHVDSDPESLSRTITQWIDESGQPVSVGKLTDARTGVTQVPVAGKESGAFDTEYLFRPNASAEPIRVTPAPATGEQTLPLLEGSGLTMEQDPIRSLFFKGQSQAKKATFMDWVNKLFDEGYLKRAGEIAEPDEAGKLIPKEYPLLPKHEIVDLPGFVEGSWQAEKPIIRRLEQTLGVLPPKDTFLGGVAHGMDYVLNKTVPGQMFTDTTNTFKRNALGRLPFVFSNALSDLSLEYLGMHTPGWNMPARWVQSIKGLKGSAQDMQPGMGLPLKDFADEMWKQDLMRKSVRVGDEAGAGGGYLSSYPTDLTKALLTSLDMPTFGKAAQPVANAVGKWNQWFLDQATKFENRAKFSNADDWARAHAQVYKDALGSGDLDAIKEFMAEAARAGHSSKLDYHNLPPFGQLMTRPVPFYNFQQGIYSRLADAAINNPAKLRRLDDFYNTVAMPLSEERKKHADEWIKNNAPLEGLFGTSFDQMFGNHGATLPEGTTRMALGGRFVPFTNPMNLTGGDESLAGMANPLLKIPVEWALNKSFFKKRPIDQYAESPNKGLLNAALAHVTMDETGKYPREYANRQLFGWTPPAALDHLLSNMPGGGHVNELNQLSQAVGLTKDAYRPTSLLDSALWLLTGARFYPYDEQRGINKRNWEWNTKDKTLKYGVDYTGQKGEAGTAQSYQEMRERHREEKPPPYKKIKPQSSLDDFTPGPVINMARAGGSSQMPYYVPDETDPEMERALSYAESA